MGDAIQIKSALISVFDKTGLDPIVDALKQLGVEIYSTGGTQKYIENLGAEVHAVESLTDYPSILGGRVKTLHPKVFGGILSRREEETDVAQMEEYEIPPIDLVIVDLYPFEETLAQGGTESEIIEKIDIGGIALIRAAAKNFKDVAIVPSKDNYQDILDILQNKQGKISLDERKALATQAFHISSHYDSAIFNWFDDGAMTALKTPAKTRKALRYGENPHQKGFFFGDLDGCFEQLHGKELSYNNLLDIDAAVHLMMEFKEDDPTFAILKHNNACGLATRDSLEEAYKDALAGDPVSAFGGILIANRDIDSTTADQINELFCEVVIAPGFTDVALETLKGKKKRILLRWKNFDLPQWQVRTNLNGYLVQERDAKTESKNDFETVTETSPAESLKEDLVFANKIVKHSKSNTIVLAKNKQLMASGVGQTSRVDALRQAINKAKSFDFDLTGGVMASDAFFPFPDCVEIAHEENIDTVIQPGGSIKDKLSIEFCNNNRMAMVFTGNRHFKH